MSKPLHKDLSFWIVAVVLVGAADLAQVHFGFPWFADRIAATRKAPRASAPAVTASRYTQPRNPPHAPDEWRLPYSDSSVLKDTPPQVTLLPTRFHPPPGGWTPNSRPQGGWVVIMNDMAVGIRIPPEEVLEVAYKWHSYARIVMPPGLPWEQYDFIANVHTGALETLQKVIKTKLGLVADRETIQTNALVLTVNRPGALKPLPPGRGTQFRQDVITFSTVPNLVSYLEAVLHTPILDQTGLRGRFNLQIPFNAIRPLPANPGGQPGDRFEPAKKYLLDQFGLALTETNAPVEMLVVRRVN